MPCSSRTPFDSQGQSISGEYRYGYSSEILEDMSWFQKSILIGRWIRKYGLESILDFPVDIFLYTPDFTHPDSLRKILHLDHDPVLHPTRVGGQFRLMRFGKSGPLVLEDVGHDNIESRPDISGMTYRVQNMPELKLLMNHMGNLYQLCHAVIQDHPANPFQKNPERITFALSEKSRLPKGSKNVAQEWPKEEKSILKQLKKVPKPTRLNGPRRQQGGQYKPGKSNSPQNQPREELEQSLIQNLKRYLRAILRRNRSPDTKK
ncbi:hypothetical protein TWF173_002563 [Orbilia oligospora]|nr:hypothetical protein TWF173_002563 [Orbilia oligospora]